MGVRDDQFHTLKTTAQQAPEKTRPEWLSLAGADVQADDLPPAFGVYRHSNYGRDTDHPASFTQLKVCGVKPHIGPIALKRP